MAAEASPVLDRRTTKTRAVIFGAVRTVGYARIGEALGIGESTACEWLQKHGDRIALLLTAIGQKPVPVDVECASPKTMKDLRYYASIGIKVDPEQLPHDDEPVQLWDDAP